MYLEQQNVIVNLLFLLDNACYFFKVSFVEIVHVTLVLVTLVLVTQDLGLAWPDVVYLATHSRDVNRNRLFSFSGS